jgi:RNA polymerase sigma-70 factor (ECF subfamily)
MGADAPSLRLVGSGGDLVAEPRYADWEAVYRDNVSRVYRMLYAKVGTRADAEDLTTEVFMAALGPMRLDVSAPEVRSYLFTTARTVLAGHWRRTMGLEVTALDTDDERWLVDLGPEPEAPSAAPERAAEILAALPEPHRRILQLRFIDRCSIREAAAAMGITVGYAKVLQHRAIKRAAGLGEEGT